MAKFGKGYGSECRLLRFLGQHHQHFYNNVLNPTGHGHRNEWLHDPFKKKNEHWLDSERSTER